MTEPVTDRVVGKYRLGRILGRGGMGEVYVGEHTLLGRTAAVKLLSPRISDSKEALERFFREAVATSQVKHPGIVHVYDYGRDDSGVAFLIMELLEGETLKRRIDRIKKIPLVQAIALGGQLAGVLAATHSVGIVHRDLKPANIFVVPDGDISGGERVKVLDFGIAKLTESGDFAELTADGALLGTPVYMSPEQCRSRRDVGSPSDVYALGCVLYRLVTGRPPFVSKSISELVIAHCTQAPAPLPDVAPRRLDVLVRQMLEKAPGDRPTADQVRADLELIEKSGLESQGAPRAWHDEVTRMADTGTAELLDSALQSAHTEVDPATGFGATGDHVSGPTTKAPLEATRVALHNTPQLEPATEISSEAITSAITSETIAPAITSTPLGETIAPAITSTPLGETIAPAIISETIAPAINSETIAPSDESEPGMFTRGLAHRPQRQLGQPGPNPASSDPSIPSLSSFDPAAPTSNSQRHQLVVIISLVCLTVLAVIGLIVALASGGDSDGVNPAVPIDGGSIGIYGDQTNGDSPS